MLVYAFIEQNLKVFISLFAAKKNKFLIHRKLYSLNKNKIKSFQYLTARLFGSNIFKTKATEIFCSVFFSPDIFWLSTYGFEYNFRGVLFWNSFDRLMP